MIKRKPFARIDIRCTPEEKIKIKELARDRGMTISEYVKEKIFGRKIVVRFHEQDPRFAK